MSLKVDQELIREGELSELSRKTLQLDVFEYQLRSLFIRPGYRPGDVRVKFFYPKTKEKGEDEEKEIKANSEKEIKANSEKGFAPNTEGGFQLLVSGPVYTELDQEEDYSPFIRQWRGLFMNYLFPNPFRGRFINGMIQLRFVSFNPLTIYYQMLMEEQKKVSFAAQPVSKLGMKRMIVNPQRRNLDQIPRIRPIREKPSAKKLKEKKEEEIEEPEVKTMINGAYDGVFSVERSEEEAQRPGVTSWAEGYVQDEIPADVRKIDPELDYPKGAIMNMFPDYPFYAFSYWNVFKKIEGLNRMIEAGLEVVFLKEVSGMDMGRVRDLYVEFFTSWGIPIIDYVTVDRLRNSGLTYMIPSDNILPPFFVIRRPVEKFHSSDWAGMNGFRRRGLVGIPWARDELSGNLLIDPQPDDGFLSKFVKEGLEKRLAGKSPEMEVRFPLCTLHTPSEIRRRVIDPLEALLKRNIHFRMEGTAELRNMGEWILLRGLMRKNL